MALSAEQQEYLDKHPLMKRLTFNGVDDLYNHFVYGAYTIDQCIQLDRVSTEYYKTNANKGVGLYMDIPISEELSIRRERCVDENGMGEAAW